MAFASTLSCPIFVLTSLSRHSLFQESKEKGTHQSTITCRKAMVRMSYFTTNNWAKHAQEKPLGMPFTGKNCIVAKMYDENKFHPCFGSDSHSHLLHLSLGCIVVDIILIGLGKELGTTRTLLNERQVKASNAILFSTAMFILFQGRVVRYQTISIRLLSC